ncbi:MAG: carbamoyltransferase family protein, partial [Nevskiaceae bacterium]
AEEERFRRVKHWAGFPEQAVRYCLAHAGIGLDQVAHVAVNTDPRAQRWRKLAYVALHRPSPALLWQRLRALGQRRSIEAQLARRLPERPFKGKVHHVEHHLAHLASAFLVSPFPRAALLSVDGFGDFSSVAWGAGEGIAIEMQERVFFPHSLGIFYEAMTQYLGFPRYGDEYKVMGLAAYGRPRYLKLLQEVIHSRAGGRFLLDLRYFRHHREQIEFRWQDCEPQVGTLYTPVLEHLLGPARRPDDPVDERHRDLAASVQAMYEEHFFHIVRTVHERTGFDALCLAGGCAMNSVANGKVTQRTPFKDVYVQSAAGDAGGALGAAAYVASHLDRHRPRPMLHANWGPEFGRAEIERELASQRVALEQAGCRPEWLERDELCRRTAEAIASGKVIGWFQGRMEWGPRALGNRSILCDPRRADMKDILNLKIKRRESFRPFAPSVLREQVGEWFEQDADVPFMTQVFMIRPDKRAQIPAVTHVDGSGRLQTVNADANARYHALISEFHRQTGVPMVLNTSFNENEPVVCQPREALDCFLRTKMDVLVLGEAYIERNQS